MTFLYLKSCLTEPKQLLRLIVLVICSAVAAYQLSECFYKLHHPPISTHYGYLQNETMEHPAVTVCRNPPYKSGLFAKYNLSSVANLTYSSVWKYFSYEKFNISELFEEASYELDEMIVFKGLNGHLNNFDVRETLTLSKGKCYTLLPHHDSTPWKSGGGWALAALHDEMVRRQSSYKVVVAGFYIWLHNSREIFTERRGEQDTTLESFYLEAGEELQVKLKMEKYNQIQSNDNICDLRKDYSEGNCKEACRNKKIVEAVGYKAPFLLDDRNYPLCNSYECMRTLIATYKSDDNKWYANCDCAPSCNTTFYSPFILNRKIVIMPESRLYIFYSSNFISLLEETLGYDWNRFLADLGGSLGFLLGLSVLGAIGLLEQVLKVAIKTKNMRKISSEEKPKAQDIESTDSVKNNLEKTVSEKKDLKDIDNLYFPKSYHVPELKNDDLLTKTVNK